MSEPAKTTMHNEIRTAVEAMHFPGYVAVTIKRGSVRRGIQIEGTIDHHHWHVFIAIRKQIKPLLETFRAKLTDPTSSMLVHAVGRKYSDEFRGRRTPLTSTELTRIASAGRKIVERVPTPPG